MALVVFNTLTKKKEGFCTLQPGVVRMYNCGPTVYSRVHIGNIRAFLFADLLRRWLEYSGLEVHQVMNITDVGHLTDDENDEGDDKIEARARREAVDPRQIAAEYTDSFLRDIAELGVLEPESYPRATDHVPEMLAIIEDLIAKDFAYEVDGQVYFDVTRFEAYGRLSGNRIDDLEAGARIKVREDKRHPADFALWKRDSHHLVTWESRFGPDGFPGWHIECSAMALKHLGEQIDIHTGGEDNVFPHHECEIAQSECHTGKPFARFWMHTKFLLVDGGKMSKSLGNTYTIDDVKERGFDARTLRYSLIRGHYRQPLNFTWDIMQESRAALQKLDELVDRLGRASATSTSPAGAGQEAYAKSRKKFEAGMDDDLNVPTALSALFELRSTVLEDKLGPDVATEALQFVRRALTDVLGVPRQVEEATDDAEIDALVQARLDARKAKDWAESDRLRDELIEHGIVLQDTADGTIWRRK